MDYDREVDVAGEHPKAEVANRRAGWEADLKLMLETIRFATFSRRNEYPVGSVKTNLDAVRTAEVCRRLSVRASSRRMGSESGNPPGLGTMGGRRERP